MTILRNLTLAAIAGAWLTLQPQEITPTPTPTPQAPSPAPIPSSSIPDSTQLEVTKVVQPDYPLEAAAKKLQGKVMIKVHILETGDVDKTEIVIGEDGKIHDLQALCGAPQLVAASMEAVHQWRYRPYMRDGIPIAVETTVKVQFRM
jgi:TonB family protein